MLKCVGQLQYITKSMRSFIKDRHRKMSILSAQCYHYQNIFRLKNHFQGFIPVFDHDRLLSKWSTFPAVNGGVGVGGGGGLVSTDATLYTCICLINTISTDIHLTY